MKDIKLMKNNRLKHPKYWGLIHIEAINQYVYFQWSKSKKLEISTSRQLPNATIATKYWEGFNFIDTTNFEKNFPKIYLKIEKNIMWEILKNS